MKTSADKTWGQLGQLSSTYTPPNWFTRLSSRR